MQTEQTSEQRQTAWSDIDWAAAEAVVKQLQGRIYRAAAAGKPGQVKNLQKLLVRSLSAKRLAVRRVTQQNAGRNTPGIDGVVCRTPEGRMRLADEGLSFKGYRPQPVRRVHIPKSDGRGRTRPLGIPTIRDRALQMLVKLALEPEWETRFETNSYGFRPGRCTMDAIVALHATLAPAGASAWMLDADISGCFDRVNHDRLMARVAARVPDRRVLRLVRSFLTAGVLNNGLFEASREGAPQGGPVSPLLSNLVLDELDRELERRGHRFVRYADDCNVYVRSEKAGRRVMASLTRFIEGRLKLQVNTQKSAVARSCERSFLGFTVTDEPQPRRRIADKAVARFKDRVRDLTRRHRGVSLERVMADLNPLLRGWAGYFGFSQMRELGSLDGWTRRRLRCVVWVQWKTRGRRYQELRRLKVSEKVASAAIFSPKGPWRPSSSSALHRAYTNARFKRLGLLSMETLASA